MGTHKHVGYTSYVASAAPKTRLRVTGDPEPDVTGVYDSIGIHELWPAWKHHTLNWYIYNTGAAYIISSGLEEPPPPEWYKELEPMDPTGDYLPTSPATGICHVERVY